MTADDIVAAARQCVGTPFRHQGRVVGKRLDCAGVVVHVAKTNGCKHCDVIGYAETPYGDSLRENLDTQVSLVRVAGSNMMAGDILLMRFDGEPQHLAVFTGENIIHAWSEAGKCCEHGLDTTWRRRIAGVYRFRGVT